MSSNPAQPLLPSASAQSSSSPTPSARSPLRQRHTQARHRARSFLTSKLGHYAVLALVSLDVSCIFSDIFLELLACDKKDEPGPDPPGIQTGQEVLSVASILFSCLFLLELIVSVWAFGWKYGFSLFLLASISSLYIGLPGTNSDRYFSSPFPVFDAFVIIASFTVDVLLHGVLEEVASLVVVLRLWRVFKIIEELSAGANERMEGLVERVEKLETENAALKRRAGRVREGDGEG
ncbi:MAG: hypothetical protein M4579_006425 [Chaenotheca gracillima]|nr:MAG: hypothetical protein M4579_006425 [Chaenotheca gracillima]